MTEQFVSKIGDLYLVTVLFDTDRQEIRTASFGLPVVEAQVVWNLVNLGAGEPARFTDDSILPEPGGPLQLGELRKLSDTQMRGRLVPTLERGIWQLRYIIDLEGAVGRRFRHDPSIIVSPDPVEIP